MKVFHLPDLGEGLAEAEIREWYVKPGDEVKVDQPLVSMETAKAVVDVPSPYAGKIVQLHGEKNAIVKTGAPLITFEVEGGSVVADKPKGSVVGALEEGGGQWHEKEMTIGAATSRTGQVKAMPAARVLAKELNVDLAKVKGTGPQGLITPEDVKKQNAKSSRLGSLEGKQESLHGVRRVMAGVMTEAQEIAATSIIEDADITDLGKEVDLTVLILQAMVAAAKAEPSMNAWYEGKTTERKLFDQVNIGLAVDSAEGLFVPVIKNAGNLSAKELREVINKYKEGVRARSLPQETMQGATITLSNFGNIAGRYATPVVVPPTVAILGVGRSRETAVVRNGALAVGRLLPLSLTFDHRAVTGGEATRFLATVIEKLKA